MSKQRQNLIHSAIKNCDLQRVRQLIKKDIDFVEHKSDRGERPLGIAVELNYVEIVKELLRVGADPDIGGLLNPLHTAIENRNIEIVKLLLNAGADPNLLFEGEIPLTIAAWLGDLEVVQLLVEAGVDVNLYNANIGAPLVFAACQGHRDVYDYLAGLVSPEFKKKSELDAILYAVNDDNVSMIDFLANSRINFNILIFDKTPLMEATWQRHLLSVKALMQWGADVNIKNEAGMTALMFAARFRNSIEARRTIKGEQPRLQEDLVNLLARAGADLNDQDRQGKTALIHATEFGYYQVVNLLIKLGSDVHIKDFEGMTAMSYAKNLKALLGFEKQHRLQTINCLQDTVTT